MEFLVNNWYLFVAFAAVGFILGIGVYHFVKMPTNEQLDAFREWLLGAVTLAERELGSGTGQLKLRRVYDLFLVRFPWLAKVISFNTFSDFVDDALIDMREMLANNTAVQAYVEDKEVVA